MDHQIDDMNGSEKALSNKATQVLLQKACKRLQLWSNGTKTVLVPPLKLFNMNSRIDFANKAHDFDKHVPMPTFGSTVCATFHTRQPPWSPRELAHLFRLLVDFRYFTSRRKLYGKTATRAEYEIDHNDSCSAKFEESFLDSEYQPEKTESTDDITQ